MTQAGMEKHLFMAIKMQGVHYGSSKPNIKLSRESYCFAFMLIFQYNNIFDVIGI